eukprot:CAMPEP_0172618628 /NCGR_PEP_ID=MMETSP1068-20121228/83368_1 /TAXON_ID=35684 /ORGANISM="Pseudopedinella elastica, Strain CCMP716" /LENGTH=33 /DNA_ID= /DNA_START= /DNA_END= /DNA_ORIENTATION=
MTDVEAGVTSTPVEPIAAESAEVVAATDQPLAS